MVEFDDLLAAAKKNPDDADFLKLRLAYPKSPYYEPYEFDMVAHRSLGLAMEKNDFNAAIEAVCRLLDKCYLDIHAHMLAVDVYRGVEDEVREAFHLKFAIGLLNSILNSGNGHSYRNAFVVISTQEEYALLSVLNLELIMQAQKEHDDHHYDVLEISHPQTGMIEEMFFNIDLPLNWLDSQVKECIRSEETQSDVRRGAGES